MKRARNLTLFILTASMSQALASQVPTCREAFEDIRPVPLETTKFPRKVAATLAAPVRNLVNAVTHVEDAFFMSTATYRKFEQSLPQGARRPVRNSILTLSNGSRKAYNSLAMHGFGLPIPNIPTRENLGGQAAHSPHANANAPASTYWDDLENLNTRFAFLRNMSRGTRFSLRLMMVAASTLFGVHTAGNIALEALAVPIPFDPGSKLEELIPLEPHQIELLNETWPFPHTAVRIGNQIYSHGFGELTQTYAGVYLLSHLGPIALDSSLGQANTIAKALQEFSGLHRSIDSIVLNLDVPSVQALQAELMAQVNKSYANLTFVNSCTSMVVRAIARQGIQLQDSVLDASPSLLFSHLAIYSLAGHVNRAGQPLVAKIHAIHYGPSLDPQERLTKFMIRQLESAVQLNVNLLPVHIARRIALDARVESFDQLYADNEVRQKELESIRLRAADELRSIQTYHIYRIAKKNGAPETDLARYRKALEAVLIEGEARAFDPNASFADFYFEQMKLELMRAALRNE